ncbi:peptidoglycan-binding protein [Anaerotignum propionicum]|uniref:Peptidoglycan binding domain protein n=1 Tax=Anaerotignum propionicum DSM 1682 TaxID=991789 RepID=A0A0X1U8C0_ANAPI|nr:peptidoglycan-binding protein [Anaerotignum propionicum]AMJ41171.1 putative peptidoglycan binding domain protein [Anaerotignum propionicum DSM 1682]MEA5057626.1 peptidoglycan-binding protein [Anaerotignum propionicum]SHE65155.1 Putative peptidoglycan binding domain-containing protein [[Clostridium] propionicum DSM 1682] [Anaerotignum propionicum DSM 1682]HBF66547.1 peptidoglycan-binding protein [Clostridium sp.]
MANGKLFLRENYLGGTGLLRINTFLTNIARPAAGATVTVMDPYDNTVIEEAVTNDWGEVPPIPLSAPPIEYSMEYDMPRPFNQYNVRVALEDYEEAVINNVQIFPETTAVQEVKLTPSFSDINIPYPVLYGDYPPKIPESEIKKLPFPSNQVVLPQPVVPSIIVVHDGRPEDTSAANYTVTFKDYIKNVASSEIYATWPVESIKANVHVILSFTLNRVYTEWYRNKGFDFTITNSTAFDQAFTFGRNIFQEISDVVDEIFATYIGKPDIRQPLFTQYSDGRRVVREGWLSQWGSKDLGDQGLNALQILRNYYGSNVFIKEAEKVEGIPISFPGSTLIIGSTGDAVRTIQQQLNAISNNYPLIPKLIEDGYYGETTAESVRVFQQIFNLPQTGTVNYPTWYKISDVYVAIQRLA